MSTSLDALLTQLTWKKNEATSALHLAEQECLKLVEQMNEFNQKLNQAHPQSTHINPELEINRLHFNTHLQDQKEKVHSQLKEQQEKSTTYENKVQRMRIKYNE